MKAVKECRTDSTTKSRLAALSAMEGAFDRSPWHLPKYLGSSPIYHQPCQHKLAWRIESMDGIGLSVCLRLVIFVFKQYLNITPTS